MHQVAEHFVRFITLSEVHPFANDLNFAVSIFAIITIDPVW